MKYLRIVNAGEIDEKALFLLGASTKEGQNKIGFFGSGNKYAIATLMRLGVGFKIFSGDKEISISTECIDFRGEHFDQIKINEKLTSFTTRMGPSWELWYALREFYSNALDEGGAEMEEVEEILTYSGVTSIFIEEDEEVREFLEKRGQYFISSEPLWKVSTKDGEVRVYAGDGKRRIFRKGICVYEEDREAKYWYDFDKLTINESRVAQYSFEYLTGIANAMLEAPEDQVSNCAKLLRGDSDSIEGQSMFIYSNSKVSQAWLNYLGSNEIVKYSWQEFLPPEDISNSIILTDALVTTLQERTSGLNFRDKCNSDFVEMELPEKDRERVRDIVNKLSEVMGTSISFEEILFGKFKSENVLGSYSSKDYLVRISIDCISDEEKFKQILYEECILHKDMRFPDGSRSMEQYLMSKCIALSEERERNNKSNESISRLLGDMRSLLKEEVLS